MKKKSKHLKLLDFLIPEAHEFFMRHKIKLQSVTPIQKSILSNISNRPGYTTLFIDSVLIVHIQKIQIRLFRQPAQIPSC